MASFYRPPYSRNETLTSIHNDIGYTMRKYKYIQCVIGVVVKLPGFVWLEEELLDRPGKGKRDLHLNMMNKYGVRQHSEEVNSQASNNSGSVSHVYCSPDLTCHCVVIASA